MHATDTTSHSLDAFLLHIYRLTQLIIAFIYTGTLAIKVKYHSALSAIQRSTITD